MSMMEKGHKEERPLEYSQYKNDLLFYFWNCRHFSVTYTGRGKGGNFKTTELRRSYIDFALDDSKEAIISIEVLRKIETFSHWLFFYLANLECIDNNRTVENNAYVCRIEIFPPKINVKFQVSYTYDRLSIYIGHFML